MVPMTKKKSPARQARERQCVIVSNTLEDILATCNRNIRNISMTLMDALEEQDDTPADHFYCGYYRESWQDLRDDVMAMLAAKSEPKQEAWQLIGAKDEAEYEAFLEWKKKREQPEIGAKYYAYIIEGTEYERGWGCRPDGVVALPNEVAADAWIQAYNAKYNTAPSAPDEYTRYDKVGIKEVSFETFKKMDGSKPVHAQRLHELQ